MVRCLVSGGLRILVVDDHPVNRHILAELFAAVGCAVATEESGPDALAASSTERFDLVCLDRHMPGLSGDEVAAGLPADQFVLAWSTDLTDLPSRFNGTLSKPVTLDAVQGAITRAIAWQISLARRAGGFPRLRSVA